MNDDDGLTEEATQYLLDLGVPEVDIERARRQGLLSVLAVSRVAVPGQSTYTQAEVAEKAGMPVELSKRFWRALGFADVAEDARVFTDVDVEALLTVSGFIQVGLMDPEVAVQMSRVVGSSMARIADAQLGLRADSAERTDVPDAQDFLAITVAAALDSQARLLEYVWRRHLQAASLRAVMAAGASGGLELTIGFADLVGFTALSQQLEQRELAALVTRFETVAYDTIAAHGGRIAKMIGDEVMFVIDSPTEGVLLALDLAEAYASDDVLSDVRVGLACGPVLSQEGDFYGPVVNLASRIVNIALAGSVVISDQLHDAVADDDRFAFRSLRFRVLKDIGRVRLWVVRRPSEESAGGRERRAERRARLARVAQVGRDVVHGPPVR